MYLILYNITCYKYNTSKSKTYNFNFLKFKSVFLHINHNKIIEL